MAEKTHTGQRRDKLAWTAEFFSLPFNSSALYYHQTTTRRYGHASTPLRSLPIIGQRNMHSLRLWNGMFDRHRAEITVMQFTGHSLPVHHFVTAPWDFYLVPYCQPSCILQYHFGKTILESQNLNELLTIEYYYSCHKLDVQSK